MLSVKFETIFNNLPNMFRNLRVEADKGEQRAAEQCAELARGFVPVDTGALQESIHAEKDEEIGWAAVAGSSETYYALYQEYGTVHQSGTPFMTPASEASRSPFLIDMSGIPERAAGG